MSDERDPQKEKARDYAKQHRAVSGESRHAERRNRPRRRASTHRAYRREVKQALNPGNEGIDPERADEMQTAVAEANHHDFVIWQPVSLGETVEDRRRYRAAEAGRIYLHGAYESSTHREPFRRFLESVVNGGVAPSRELAERFKKLMDALDQPGGSFLEGFFEDEPAWKGRLERWVLRTLRA